MTRPKTPIRLLIGLLLIGLLAACTPTAPPPAVPAADEPAAAEGADASEAEAPADTAAEGNEAPVLAEMVAAGDLPPLEERLPATPVTVDVIERIGDYGGTWDMAVTGQADANGAISYSQEPWVIYDVSCSEWSPNLAESVEVSEDGTTFTFTIREGQKWSDGEPFTTDDIMFWYNDVAMNEEIMPSPPSIIVADGEAATVEAVDDRTFRVQFAEPNGLFLLNLAFVFGGDIGKTPAHYLQQFHTDYADADELDAMVSEAGFENWTQLFMDRAVLEQGTSVATNPDLPVLRAWKLKAQGPPWVFERNPYYYKVDPEGRQLPYIDQIRLQAVEDNQMVTLKAISGEVNYQTRNISFSDLPLFMQNREQGDYRVIKALSEHPMGVTLFPNQNYVGDDDFMLELIQDIRFRKALNLAVNRDELNELIYLGENGPVQTAFPQLADDAELFDHLRYDPEAAMALLDEIGLETDANGNRLRPDGEALVLNVDVFSGQQYMDAVQLVASYWEAIGLQVSPQEISYDLWWPRIGSYEYPITAYVKDSIGGLARFVYLRSYAPISSSTYWGPEWGTWYGGGGEEGEGPPEGSPARRAQELFDEAKVTVDSERQLEILQEIERLDLENVWEVLTVGPGPNIKIVKNNFRNVPEENYCVLYDSDSWAEQYFIEE